MPADGSHNRQRSLAARFYDHPYLLLVLATLGFGGNAVASRMAVGQISPMMLTSTRWGLVLAILLITCSRQVANGWPRVRSQWRAVLLMGACGYTAFNALNYVAAHYTSAVNLSIIQGAIPLMVLLGGLVLRHAPVRPAQIAGVAVAMAGVLLVASGGHLETLLKLNFNIGDLMIIKDHINICPEHPLRGPNDERLGTRFPDMSQAYDLDLIALAKEIATEQGLNPRTGVYIGLQGPTFETPAEYRMLHTMGGDAVGMSTVAEVILARHAGMRVFAMSVITDLGITDVPITITHEEVLQAANAAAPKMAGLVEELVKRL